MVQDWMLHILLVSTLRVVATGMKQWHTLYYNSECVCLREKAWKHNFWALDSNCAQEMSMNLLRCRWTYITLGPDVEASFRAFRSSLKRNGAIIQRAASGRIRRWVSYCTRPKSGRNLLASFSVTRVSSTILTKCREATVALVRTLKKSSHKTKEKTVLPCLTGLGMLLPQAVLDTWWTKTCFQIQNVIYLGNKSIAGIYNWGSSHPFARFTRNSLSLIHHLSWFCTCAYIILRSAMRIDICNT